MKINSRFKTVWDMKQLELFWLSRNGKKYIRLNPNEAETNPKEILVLNCETNQPEFLQKWEYVEHE